MDRFFFADGTVLDTADASSREAFAGSHHKMLSQIEQLRDEVLRDAELTGRIRHKYSIKNVTGLNLLPLITYEDPFDILLHLLVGSEGTLAFMSEKIFLGTSILLTSIPASISQMVAH